MQRKPSRQRPVAKSDTDAVCRRAGGPGQAQAAMAHGPAPGAADGLRNHRHEAFARSIAQGMTGADAYRAMTGKNPKSIHSLATALLRKVKVRVDELRAAAVTETTLSMRERREFLARLVRTPIAQIDEHHPLCQSVKYVENETGRRVEYKIADKVAAIMADARLAGELTEKVQHTGIAGRPPVTLAEFNRRLDLARAEGEDL